MNRLMAIGPTALHLMGAPLPEEGDGRMLAHRFEEGTDLCRRPVAAEASAARLNNVKSYTPEELAQIEQQLKDLGVME